MLDLAVRCVGHLGIVKGGLAKPQVRELMHKGEDLRGLGLSAVDERQRRQPDAPSLLRGEVEAAELVAEG